MIDQIVLVKALASHFIGDFAFQSDWMAQNKGKSFEVNFYHAATYTATFVLLQTGFSIFEMGIIFISHFVIDLFKARWHIIKHIWIDQLLHLVIILFIVFL